MAADRQCLGRTGPFYSSRCQRRIDRVFCGDHRLQWLSVPLLIVPAALGYIVAVATVAGWFLGPSQDEIDFQRDALTSASLVAHSWKNHYFSLRPEGMQLGDSEEPDLWTRLEGASIPNYSPEVWAHYRPLFVERINALVDELQTLLATHGSVMPMHVRRLVSQTARQLQVDQSVYLLAQRLGQAGAAQQQDDVLGVDKMFALPFRDVPRTLGVLDDEVQRLRDELPGD